MSDLSNSGDFSVAAVIPAYNAEHYIGRAIDSVLAQSRPADEIIVVNDGSNDNTEKVIKTYGDKVQYVRQENAGPGAARNTGIKTAQSKWIAFLDADDEWMSDYLKMQLQLLQRNPEMVWSSANYQRCLCYESKRSPHLPVQKVKQLMGPKEYFESYFQAFLLGCDGCMATIIVKKQALIDAGWFTTELPRNEDFDMWLRIAYTRPKIGHIAQPLAVYHLDVEGSVTRSQRNPKATSDFLERHLKLAAKQNKEKEFAPCARTYLTGDIRSMLFDDRIYEVRQLMRKFDRLLTKRYKLAIWALTVFPKATVFSCRMISRIIRLLSPSRRVKRRPLP